MIALDKLTAHINDLLGIEKFQDYAPNGLQIEGADRVNTIISGVTASQSLIDAAIEKNADVLLVHHGYFWKGESPVLTGIKYKRIRALIKHGVALLAYHLPLDAHPLYGNNVQLAQRLGLGLQGTFCRQKNSPDIGVLGQLKIPVSADELAIFLDEVLGRTPVHVSGGEGPVQRIGLCTGGAQGYIEEAAALGLDAFISGEISEKTTHLARELGIHYYAAGHHATERYGVQALGAYLARTFSIKHYFIDIDNPA